MSLARLRASICLGFVFSACAGEAAGPEREVVDVDFGMEARPENATCHALPRPLDSGVTLEPAFPNLYAGAAIVLLRARLDPAQDGSWHWFLAQKEGVVRAFADPDVADPPVFLDISDLVQDFGESGLLGLALDPDFTATPGPGSHAVYVYYTGGEAGGEHDCPENESGTRLCTFVSRFEVTSPDGGESFVQGAETILMRVQQPYDNHNGGHIAFGPDELLYIALGDGGSGGDPLCSGQNLNTPHGKILRIDVRGADEPYGIPADNPFGQGAALCNDHVITIQSRPGDDLDATRSEPCPETFAYGLRNPWRFSFDRATGALWVGDVGQDEIEEVNLVTLGGNYGWDSMEGADEYGGSNCLGEPPLGDVLPVADYDHDLGTAVTGGVVYRGSALPGLLGWYLFTDSGSGNIWALSNPYGRTEPVRNPQPLLEPGGYPVHVAEDEAGEVYFLNLWGGGGTAAMRLVPSEGGASLFPALLSQTGCVDADSPWSPAPGLIAYELNAPLWSDGADKGRFLALPDEATLAVDDGGDILAPVGTVLMKRFEKAGQRLETRLLMRHDDGGWAGYTYIWNEAQDEAYLASAHEDRDIGGQVWAFPSRSECLACHTSAAGSSLGLELQQLDRKVIYPGLLRAGQLATFEHIGLFSEPLPAVEPLPEPHGDGDLEGRARAYLHANCSHCHRPGGGAIGTDMDLRYSTALADTGTCDVAPSQGTWDDIDTPRLLAPGAPERSLLWVRLTSTDPARQMPPLARNLVDEDAAQLISAWISGVAACP